MANASLTYEILMYLDSFFFGLLACCEIGMTVLKAINLKYSADDLQMHCILLVVILTVATVRVYLGRRGCLADRGMLFNFSWFLCFLCVLVCVCAPDRLCSVCVLLTGERAPLRLA